MTQDIAVARHSSTLSGRVDLELSLVFASIVGVSTDFPVGCGQRSIAPKGTVLVVEHDPRDRVLLADILTKGGFEVHEAATGAEGAYLCRGVPFDAITFDRRLSPFAREQFLMDVRASRLNQDTPVVIATVLCDDGAKSTPYTVWLCPVTVAHFASRAHLPQGQLQ